MQRKSGHVTLLDIAQACGYSVSTVSIVLSEAPLSLNVAASTRDRIRKWRLSSVIIPTLMPAPFVAVAARQSPSLRTTYLIRFVSPSFMEFRRAFTRQTTCRSW